MNIREFINAVRNRPQMYVEEVRIDYLFYLIFGFLGNNLMDNQYCIDKKFSNLFYDWVLNWVKKNVDDKYECSSLFWYHIFVEVTDTESEAVELFFVLCKDFFEQFDDCEKQ